MIVCLKYCLRHRYRLCDFGVDRVLLCGLIACHQSYCRNDYDLIEKRLHSCHRGSRWRVIPSWAASNLEEVTPWLNQKALYACHCRLVSIHHGHLEELELVKCEMLYLVLHSRKTRPSSFSQYLVELVYLML